MHLAAHLLACYVKLPTSLIITIIMLLNMDGIHYT